MGDLGSIPRLGRFPGEGKGYPLQYSGLENSMDCKVHGVAKSPTRLSTFHFHWKNWTAVCRRMKIGTPYSKINSKWIKDLNIRPETVKLLEKNIGKTLSDIPHSRILYDPPPRILEIKGKINKWDLIKLKSFCTTKETISKVKRTFRMGENNCK